jgi:hypothetical protein
MTPALDLDELGPPATVAARHRALVLVDEALTAAPSFRWLADDAAGPLACFDGEDGTRYRGRLLGEEPVLWGAEAGAGRASADPERDDGMTFRLWWDREAWQVEDRSGPGAEAVIGPLLSDGQAAEWVEWQYGRPDLVLPFADFLAVVSDGMPMTPHALAAFAAGPEELRALMSRAAQLGLEAHA